MAAGLAVTGTDNLFGALEFARKAVKDGVQPNPGGTIRRDFGMHKHGPDRSIAACALTGYVRYRQRRVMMCRGRGQAAACRGRMP